MREIKFRAYWPADNPVNPMIAISFDGKIIDFRPLLKSRKIKCMRKPILMQYTGLKDKNGKEIYEGDVLNEKTTFKNNWCDRRFQTDTEILVGFENGCFVDINTGVTLYEKMRTISSFAQKIWTDYEFIDSIYENPEIIK